MAADERQWQERIQKLEKEKTLLSHAMVETEEHAKHLKNTAEQHHLILEDLKMQLTRVEEERITSQHYITELEQRLNQPNDELIHYKKLVSESEQDVRCMLFLYIIME
jgi:flagellar biosynthesis chaperone FliJ